LGVEINVPIEVRLPSGRQLVAPARVVGFGAREGTLVFRMGDSPRDCMPELLTAGYTASSWGEPVSDDEFDLSSFRETFEEWGWCGDGPPPSWLA
jgi:hypothetical protein